jgi:hypothetical protein
LIRWQRRFFPHIEEQAMSTIVIKDLPESVDLDRQAMRAVVGGARVTGRQGDFSQSANQSDNIFNYRHFARKPATGDRLRSGASKPGTPRSK